MKDGSEAPFRQPNIQAPLMKLIAQQQFSSTTMLVWAIILGIPSLWLLRSYQVASAVHAAAQSACSALDFNAQLRAPACRYHNPVGDWVTMLGPGIILLLIAVPCAIAGIRRRNPHNAPLYQLLMTRGRDAIWIYTTNTDVRVVERYSRQEKRRYVSITVYIGFRDGTRHQIPILMVGEESRWMHALGEAMPWCMRGYSDENRRAWEQLTGQAAA